MSVRLHFILAGQTEETIVNLVLNHHLMAGSIPWKVYPRVFHEWMGWIPVTEICYTDGIR